MTEPPSDDAFLLILFVVLLLCTCGALNVYAVLHAWYARWRLKDGEVLPPRFSSIGAWGLVLFVVTMSIDLGTLPRIIAIALVFTPCSLRLYEFVVGRSIFADNSTERREEDAENTYTPSKFP